MVAAATLGFAAAKDGLQVLGVQGTLFPGFEFFLFACKDGVGHVLNRYRSAVHAGYAALIELDDAVHFALDSIGASANIIDVGG